MAFLVLLQIGIIVEKWYNKAAKQQHLNNIMANQTLQTKRKTIAFPVRIIDKIERIAGRFGMDFTDYVRHLAAQKVIEEEEQTMPVYYMSDETEKALEEAEKAQKDGTILSYDSADDLMEALLSNDDE